ncbi:hypothetical protein H4Q32_015843 [Labeo rohita]|uniref:Secreted protein n=1 Tax=Labeo rohita TaxID=84645 RepID=A0ABQ8LJH3_LABRO|nr:hypothetical protein H4Q32_015843 [Labeo rohita]
MVNSGRGHAIGITAVFLTHLMLAVCYGPVFCGEKAATPFCLIFFPALSAICSPLTLLSRSLRRCPLTGTVYLSAFETNFTHTCTTFCVTDSHSTACVFLQGLTASQLALVWLHDTYTNNIM